MRVQPAVVWFLGAGQHTLISAIDQNATELWFPLLRLKLLTDWWLRELAFFIPTTHNFIILLLEQAGPVQ